MTENEFRIGFGMNLTKYLKKFGISVDILAKYTGIHRSTIFKYAKGQRIPTIVNVYKISDALGMDPWALCDFSDYNISDKYDYGDNLYNNIPKEEWTGDDAYAPWEEK